MEKATIRFYNKDIWISYAEENEKHTIHLRIPYTDTRVYFVPSTPHDLSEEYIDNPLRILRLGFHQESILNEER